MRRALLLFLSCNLVVLLFLVHSVWTLLELLVVDGLDDAISKNELPALGGSSHSHRSHMIPKIIHQTYINKTIPASWESARASCLALHDDPEWQYKLWTDEDGLEFIAEKYPEYLDTFQSYTYPIQRADAIRYFVLDYYGGIYIDLDDGCNRSLEPLLNYPAWVRKTNPTGISNDVMGAVPGHPFFKRVIHELQNYNNAWLLPYITVMASTGPLFLSIIWIHYTNEGLNIGDDLDGGRIRILFPQEYNNFSWSFFVHHVGNSWHGYDVQLIFWMARNWVFLTILGFIVGFTVIGLLWYTYQRHFLAPSDIPRWRAQSLRHRMMYRWIDDNSDTEYELPNRRSNRSNHHSV